MKPHGRPLSTTFALCILGVTGVATLPATAQTARSGSSANAQLTQQLQQLASERTALQAENARMKKELADLARERDALKAGQAALNRRVQASELAATRAASEKNVADGEAEKLQQRMQELVEKFRETAQLLREVETERASFKQSLTTKDAELTACIDRNVALYKLNGEVLARMENDGFFSRVARAEPFTRLKRVELENLIDDYRYRADEQRIAVPPTASAPPGAAPASSE